jgi:alkanesulfonate monooxygenase SsuD/methylene tetrahydromethanopterin reductase-like flavin-dependent oxidoreductase (luciferase family)
VTAAVAWKLQEATSGKFRLGLGTQVRTHVVRRYGMEFERPGPRLRDYVRAVKGCFHAFRTGTLATSRPNSMESSRTSSVHRQNPPRPATIQLPTTARSRET